MAWQWVLDLCEKYNVNEEGLGPHSCCGELMHSVASEFEGNHEMSWCCMHCDNEKYSQILVPARRVEE